MKWVSTLWRNQKATNALARPVCSLFGSYADWRSSQTLINCHGRCLGGAITLQSRSIACPVILGNVAYWRGVISMRSFGEGHHAALERRNSVPDLVASPAAALWVAFVGFMKEEGATSSLLPSWHGRRRSFERARRGRGAGRLRSFSDDPCAQLCLLAPFTERSSSCKSLAEATIQPDFAL
jgi:hypothetical protein